MEGEVMNKNVGINVDPFFKKAGCEVCWTCGAYDVANNVCMHNHIWVIEDPAHDWCLAYCSKDD